MLSEVVLNQALIRFRTPDGDQAASDALTRDVVREVQEEGTIWLSATVWHGHTAMRISVSNWGTGADEAEVAVDAILRAADRARQRLITAP